MAIRYKTLVEDFRKLGVEDGRRMVRETFLKDRALRNSFELPQLFESCFGANKWHACRERGKFVHDVFREDSDGTTTASFLNITGQIFYAATLERFEDEEFVFTKLIPTMDSKLLGPERIAGITRLGDQALVRKEAEAYKVAGVGENWIHAPATDDRGFVTTVTKEALFEDRTGQLLQELGDGGYAMGINLEKRNIDAFVDLNAGAASALAGGHRYHWKDTSIATYGDNSGSHGFDNLSASTSLIDWQSVNTVEQLAAQQIDPFTGEPIMVNLEDLVVCPDLVHTAKAIVTATENRMAVGGYATSGNLNTRVSPNTIKSYRIVSSRLLRARQVTAGGGLATTWYLSNIGQALRRKVNWPLETVQAPSNSEDEFWRQIVMKWRCNERSAPFWWEPRLSFKATA